MGSNNVGIARAAFEGFARGDLELVGRLLHDVVSWHTPGSSLLAGDFVGREAVLGYLARALDLTDGTQQVVPVDLMAGTDHVAALVDVTARRRGLVLNDRAIQLLGFRDGLIATRRLYPGDQAAFDLFWAP